MGLDDVLAQLTFRERFTRKRVRFERRYGALVVQVEGAPAPVRQWLGALLRNYRGVVPVNNPSDVPALPGRGGPGRRAVAGDDRGVRLRRPGGTRSAHSVPALRGGPYGALRMAARRDPVPPAPDRRPEAADQGGDHRGTPADSARAASPAEPPPGRPVRQRTHGRGTGRPAPEGRQRTQVPAPPDRPLVRHPALSPAAHLRGRLRRAGTAAQRARGGETAAARRGPARRHRRALRCRPPPQPGPPPRAPAAGRGHRGRAAGHPGQAHGGVRRGVPRASRVPRGRHHLTTGRGHAHGGRQARRGGGRPRGGDRGALRRAGAGRGGTEPRRPYPAAEPPGPDHPGRRARPAARPCGPVAGSWGR